MRRLRDPLKGCPWDLEQDFESIVRYTIEEAYEVADAIERNDTIDLKDELGDLLLQPVYLAQLAEEQNMFSFEDVVEAITRKMIRRHPHVFGDADVENAISANESWERIKKEEAKTRTEEKRKYSGHNEGDLSEYLGAVPNALPALTRAQKLQDKAAKVGFDWNELGPVIKKIEEEWQEFKEELDANNGKANHLAAGELGDFIFSVVNLARHLGIDAEDALRKTNTKFTRRFGYLEHASDNLGVELSELSLEEMEKLWVQSKGIVG